MKLTFSQLKSTIRSLVSRRASPVEVSHIAEPERDWHRLLLAFAVLCILSGVLHLGMYRSFESEAEAALFGATPVASGGKVLKRVELKRISDDIRGKEEMLQALITTPPPTIDPH